MFNNKKAILPLVSLLLSPVMLIIMGVLLLLVILAVFGFAFFLAVNVFMIIGVFLIIVGGIGLLRGFASNIGFVLIGIGILLIILPKLSSALAGITLATILP